ncbi:glutathione S-transferase II [Apiospora saccharicola]|uniref:Glutathione S-transferase II n=1 Tax=Apiospora saccharicola TaxID=335842 RepID=A0ABR1WCI8_9PEZI
MAEYPPEKAPKPGLNIYGGGLPNPAKLTIMAEELGIPYNLITMNLADIRSPWYEPINPNGKLLAIVHMREDGTSETVFESGACLLYLAHEFDKEHRFHDPVGTSGYWKQLSWLSWQISGYGPMMGQAVHFHRYTPEPVPYGAWRYGAECRRLNHVLEKQLSTSPFVAGTRPTIADFAVFIYAHSAKWCGIDIAAYPHVQAWCKALSQRPAVQRGLQVPTPYMTGDDGVVDPANQDALKMMRGHFSKVFKEASDQWWQGPGSEVVALPSDHANHGDGGAAQ